MTAGNFHARDWDSHPPLIAPDYKSTRARGPRQPLVSLSGDLPEAAGPSFDPNMIDPLQADLTRNGWVNAEPLGERIVVAGRVLDEAGRGVPHTLIEIWQANAAGRYVHIRDQHEAPLDPNFLGAGYALTDADGRYRFQTIKPGAYPWGNHHNAWRPNHIHFSVIGPALVTRLVTQMYFPGDPLLDADPIFLGTPRVARPRLIAEFDWSLTEPGLALGYRFDIVLRGRAQTPPDEGHAHGR
ncbi:protocatechuate 3,4-dioxygenase subunit beta [Rhodovibrio salinarum]|uniref:Protocatechuate 3,4-dioxygenase subunit beta n=1 Tax=Rhodovibrio salinarum TaxID=1087 RepID=A0A934QJE9_9PROT|nr:protocatechuate 3,4-dioxygenase subunit beta [Rhodovibrio salinarum]MBK1697545.1 protocatechuate 3,4-dioxygenase subunit beta [Rhodovibrio salinarum]